MRHRKAGHKLGRTYAHRRSTLRNLASGLFEHGQITTTIPKAKAVQPFAEKLISLAKRGDLHSRRLVIARLRDRIMADDESKIERNRYGELRKGPKLIKHLFEEVAPRFADRNGGYTRIIKLGKRRVGDNAELCIIQLVGDEDGPEISGNRSTRRKTADSRTAFAADTLKNVKAPVAPAPDADAQVAQEAPQAKAEASEAPTVEKPKDEG